MPHSYKPKKHQSANGRKSQLSATGGLGRPAITRSPIRKGYQQQLILNARKAKGPPEVGLPAVYGKWGRRQVSAQRRFNKKAYRMPQIQHRAKFGGTGLDEMVSTETVAIIIDRLRAAGRSLEDIQHITGQLSQEREEVRYLLWTTPDSVRPLSGHPGALSKSQTDMRRGLTEGHGDRNNIRAAWVLNEYSLGTDSEAEVLEDISIMAGIMTNQLLSEPMAKLDTVSPSTNTIPAYHPVHGKLYDVTGNAVTKGANYRKVAIDAHNARERRKWAYADRLIRRGYTSLVHPEMHYWLQKGEDWNLGLDMYMKHIGGEQHRDAGPPTSTAYTPLSNHAKMTLASWNTAAKAGTMPTAIGKPRPLISRVALTTPAPQPRYKQQLISAYFRQMTK